MSCLSVAGHCYGPDIRGRRTCSCGAALYLGGVARVMDVFGVVDLIEEGRVYISAGTRWASCEIRHADAVPPLDLSIPGLA